MARFPLPTHFPMQWFSATSSRGRCMGKWRWAHKPNSGWPSPILWSDRSTRERLLWNPCKGHVASSGIRHNVLAGLRMLRTSTKPMHSNLLAHLHRFPGPNRSRSLRYPRPGTLRRRPHEPSRHVRWMAGWRMTTSWWESDLCAGTCVWTDCWGSFPHRPMPEKHW